MALATLGLTSIAMMAGVAAQADTLSVAPTKLEARQGAKATQLTIKASGAARSTVQLRVFAWREGTAPNQLSRTNAVAISPQIAQLSSRQELTARIVHRGTPRRRECFRVLVDRLPDPNAQAREINLRIRHSIPLCFNP